MLISRQFHKEKIDFLGQISEKFRLLTDDFTKNFTLFKANFQRISIFLRQFQKKIPQISIFSGNFTKSSDFLRKFAKHFYFFRQFKKNRFFQGKFPKNFDFLGNFTKNFDFPGINWLFAAISGEMILFLFKSHHFLTYLLYMVRYNYILRPVHDPHDPPPPPPPPPPKTGGGPAPPT